MRGVENIQRPSALTPLFSPAAWESWCNKELYLNIHAQQYLDLAQITTFTESRNPEHGVLVIENVDLRCCVALGVTFGISLTQMA